MIAIATNSRFGVDTAYFLYRTNLSRVNSVHFSAYQSDAFHKTGGSDEEFDFYFKHAGGKIGFDPRIFAKYPLGDSFSRLWKQYFEYGFYNVLVIPKRWGVSSIKQLAPSAFVIVLFLSFVLAFVSGQKWIMATVLGPLLIANFGVSAYLGFQRVRTLLILPVVFGYMHIAYGVGFLAGLWRFKTFQSNVAAVPGPKILPTRNISVVNK